MPLTGRSWTAEPEALALAVGLALSGLGSLVSAPGTLTATLPWWLRTAWSVLLVAGGAARTVGLVTRRVAWDAAGCWLLASAAGAYGSVLLTRGSRGLVAGLIVLAVGAACGIRARRYHRLLRQPPDGGE